jgi:hypothetical protein
LEKVLTDAICCFSGVPGYSQKNELVNLTEIRQFRYKNLLSSCEQLKGRDMVERSIPRKTLEHIIVDDRYKVLFCYIPKVACTNLKRVFLLLTGKMNATDPMALNGFLSNSLAHSFGY